MITRFRKGQQIRQNDLNNIINGLTGRMVGGPGVNVRKMAGGMVIDADAQTRVYDQGILQYGDIVKLTLGLRPVNSKNYGFLENAQQIEKLNINVKDDTLIVYSYDEFLRIIDKDTLLLNDSVETTQSARSGNIYMPNYRNSVIDSNYIYLNYGRAGVPNYPTVARYDYDLNLIDQTEVPSSMDGDRLPITCINDTGDYISSWGKIHTKAIDSFNQIPVEIPIGNDVRACAGYCGDSDVFVSYPISDASNQGIKISRYNLAAVEQNSYIVDFGEDAVNSAITFDGTDIYLWASSLNYSTLYRLNTSLAVQDSKNTATYTGIPIQANAMVYNDGYLYAVSPWGTRTSPYETSEVLKIDASDLSFDRSWFYGGRSAIGGGQTGTLSGITTDGTYIYVIGYTSAS